MKQILISDHDLEMFHFAANALKSDYNVLPLPPRTELIQALRQKPGDAVLLCVSLSNKEGYQNADIIKRIPEMAGKPILFLADCHDSRLEEKALSLGADEYISMPVTPKLLLHRVNAATELAGLRRERPYVETYQDAISFSFAELVECRDETTGGHLKNTTKYFELLLQEAIASDQYKEIISQENVRDLLRSAALHDIGKLGITDDILRKESSLNHKEYEHMKTHTTLGKQAFEKIIKETGGARWLYLAKDIAYCHHEHWDGSGYPNGLKGEEIPLYARMLTVADVYDALTSDRAYKKAFSHKKAMDIIIEGKGSYFDPSLVDLFVKANKRFEELLLKKQALNQ